MYFVEFNVSTTLYFIQFLAFWNLKMTYTDVILHLECLFIMFLDKCLLFTVLNYTLSFRLHFIRSTLHVYMLGVGWLTHLARYTPFNTRKGKYTVGLSLTCSVDSQLITKIANWKYCICLIKMCAHSWSDKTKVKTRSVIQRCEWQKGCLEIWGKHSKSRSTSVISLPSCKSIVRMI